MVGIENQNEYNCIDFLVIVAYFRAKAENGCLTGIIIECRYNIFCRIDLFPLFIPSIPSFHYSIIPCGFPTWMAAKTLYFQQVVEIPRRSITHRIYCLTIKSGPINKKKTMRVGSFEAIL